MLGSAEPILWRSFRFLARISHEVWTDAMAVGFRPNRVFSAAECGPGRGEQVLPGVGAAVADPDAAGGDPPPGGGFQQLQPNRFRLPFGPLPSAPTPAPHGMGQHLGPRGAAE